PNASPDSFATTAEPGAITARIAATQAMCPRFFGTSAYPMDVSTSNGTSTIGACTASGCKGRPRISSNTYRSSHPPRTDAQEWVPVQTPPHLLSQDRSFWRMALGRDVMDNMSVTELLRGAGLRVTRP